MTTTTHTQPADPIPNQALIDRHRDINTDYDWWDSVYDFFTEDMRTIGIEVDDMYFSGFWSQGDGACFDGYVREWHKFLPSVDPDYNNSVLIAHASAFFSFSCKHYGHYYHKRCVQYDADLPLPESSIDMDFAERYSPYPLDDLRTAAWLAILNRFASSTLEKHFRDAFTGHMQDLYDRLETEYDYLTSDEAVWETIVANEVNWMVPHSIGRWRSVKAIRLPEIIRTFCNLGFARRCIPAIGREPGRSLSGRSWMRSGMPTQSGGQLPGMTSVQTARWSCVTSRIWWRLCAAMSPASWATPLIYRRNLYD